MSMSMFGLARIIGFGAILLLAIYGGLLGDSGGLNVVVVFQVLNTAMLFVIMTLAYEWHVTKKD